jgi:hypothetical protein
MGKTHRPFIRVEDRTSYVNEGSCGHPRDDGSLGSAALLTLSTGGVKIKRFNIEKEVREAVSPVTWNLDVVLNVFDRRYNEVVGKMIRFEAM